MNKSRTEDTWVYRRKIGEQYWYLAIKHQSTRVGWEWKHGLTDKMQEAWTGGLPSTPRNITSNLGVSLKLEDWKRVDVRITTTKHFELLRREGDG